jgi:hypothetical protein
MFHDECATQTWERGYKALQCKLQVLLEPPFFARLTSASLPDQNTHNSRLLRYPDGFCSFIPQRQLLCHKGHSHEKHNL